MKAEKLSLVGTVGAEQKYPDRVWASEFISRHHYAPYHVNDESSIRVGKFKRQYGINTDNHALYIRKDLGWNASSETYNAEYSFVWDPWADASTLSETGASITVAYALSPKAKLGLSNFYGSQTDEKREVAGPYLLLVVTDRLYLLSELDYQRRFRANTNGFFSYNQVGYEILKGLHLYFTQESSRVDFTQERTLKNAYTFGTLFFPRPHVDLNLAYRIQTRKALAPDDQDQLLYFIIHFYL